MLQHEVLFFLQNSKYEKLHAHYLYASGDKFCRDFRWLRQ